MHGNLKKGCGSVALSKLKQAGLAVLENAI